MEGTALWATRLTSGYTESLATATDSNGNVYITGYYYDLMTIYNVGGGTTLPTYLIPEMRMYL